MIEDKSAKICGPCGKEFTPTPASKLYCSKECKNLGELNHKKTKKIEARIEYLNIILDRPGMETKKDFIENAKTEIEKLNKKKAAIEKRF